MKNEFHPNTNENISEISALEVYYFKVSTKESLSSCKTEHKLSFCVNLEVVNFQGRNPRNIFVGILDETDFS